MEPPYQPLLASVPPPAPVVVVSPQFCAREEVPLTVTKKVMSVSGGDFTVTDPNGAVVLQVKGSFFGVRNRRALLDAAGHPILSMHEKVFSMHNKWEVFRGDSTNASDLLFAAKRSTLLQLKTEMDVFLAGNTTQQVCDFKIKGSYLDRNCAIYLGNSDTMIAHVISMHNTWEAYRGDSSKSSDLLFTAKKSSIIQPFKTEMYIYLASNTSHEVCDFKMNGSFKERACSFYLGDSNILIAQMHRQHTAKSTVLGRDYYGVTVFPNADYVFISALVVILQELHTDKND